MTLGKIVGLSITIMLGIFVGLEFKEKSTVSIGDTNIGEQSTSFEKNIEEPYLVAKGYESGENVITLNETHPILKETFHFFKLEPGTYELECELTNDKIPFAMILFQGTETIDEIDVNGVVYQAFPELESFYFEEGEQMKENITLDQEVYFLGSDNATFSFYKKD